MTAPTPYRLGWRKRTETGVDERNNTTYEYADPVDWYVHAVAPGATAEPMLPNRDLSSVEHAVYAPASPVPSEYDRIDYRGETYDIEGRPAAWGDGPWSGLPGAPSGIVVLLRRSEG